MNGPRYITVEIQTTDAGESWMVWDRENDRHVSDWPNQEDAEAEAARLNCGLA